MKMKSLAAFGMAGLMAATIVYVTPAMADDAADVAAMPNLAAMDQNSPASPSDNSMQNNNDGTTTDGSANTTNNDTSATPPADSSAAPADQGSPDTATGDDDY